MNDMPDPAGSPAAEPALDDGTLAARVAARDHVAFEAMMRRYNRRLFRVARAILADDSEAEEALQDSYMDAYRAIGRFRGEAQLGTWLTRIVVNRARMRLRRSRRDRIVVPFLGNRDSPDGGGELELPDRRAEPPSSAALRGEIRRILARRIDELPATFREVFVMRDIEDLSVQETADCLGIPPATVRTRLFRARALLRAALERELDSATLDVFAFAGARCDRIVAGALARVGASIDAPAGRK